MKNEPSWDEGQYGLAGPSSSMAVTPSTSEDRQELVLHTQTAADQDTFQIKDSAMISNIQLDEVCITACVENHRVPQILKCFTKLQSRVVIDR